MRGRGNRIGGGGGALNEEQLERLARYFDEELYRPETTNLRG